ncbi:MAG: tetratricopeptide repeat protein, partial [Candidatus Acidiferrum sp.]
MKEHIWLGAYQELLRTVDLQPDNWAAQLDLGNLLLRGGKGQEAKDRALLILKNNANDAASEILLSKADAILENRSEAMEEAEQAVKMAPDRAEVFLNLGLIQARYGAFDVAEKSLLKVKSLDPNSDGPSMTLATFYAQQKRWQDAENQFRTAIQVAPKDPLPRAALAALYSSEGKHELAESVLTEAKLQ